jgi:CubicO group peptidase (beta-lactamase class C family)
MAPQLTDDTIDAVLQRIDVGAAGEDGGARVSLAERMQRACTPGVSVSMFQGGRIVAARGYGVREAGGKPAVTPDTLFQAASISKPVTALAAMRLVEQGRLDLDADINDHLRSWNVPDIWSWQPRLTVRQLVSHSAGLTVHGFPGYERGKPLPDILAILNGHPPANTAAVRVDTLPGVQWRYSGGGTTILQLLLTDLTGEPFPELMRMLVLEPLGMTDSCYMQPLPEDRWDAAACGHEPDGAVVAGSWHVYPEMAAAGLWTTPSDLARFALGVLAARAGTPGSVLTSATVAEMLRPQVADHGDARLGFHGMGLGFFLGGEGQSFRFGHTGGNAGFRCLLVAYPEHDGGVAVMTNGDNGWQVIPAFTEALAESCGWPRHASDLGQTSVEAAEAYTGVYELRAGFVVSVKNTERGLTLKLPKQPPLPLRAVAGERFALDPLAAAVTFRRESDGKVSGMVLHQNLRDLPASKIN